MNYRISLLISLLSFFASSQLSAETKPNFIVILADDLGYNDLSCYGSPNINTPHLDKMAEEGIRFTDFHVASPICTASRAAFLTGCYPKRIGFGDEVKLQRTSKGETSSPRSNTLKPLSSMGLNPREMIIPEVLKPAGYKSALIGKWHLGDADEFMPVRQGFDYFFGVPYSNDMKPFYLVENEKRLLKKEDAPKHEELTKTYTEHAIKFIEDNKENPFFLYFAHNMPHVPLTPGKDFAGKSPRGLYGDAVEEMDWSVGEILKTLKDLKLDDNTLVIFFSDNGPWLVKGDEGGNAFPLRNGKASTYEGGFRVPCIMWGGGIVKTRGQVSTEFITSMDFLPTFAALAGIQHMPELPIDGKDISPIVKGTAGAKSPWKQFYYYFNGELHAVRQGKWKYRADNTLLNESIYRRNELTSAPVPAALYNLETDLGEQKSVEMNHPKTTARLKKFLAEARETLGDTLTNSPGTEVRKPGETDNMFVFRRE